MFQLSGFYYRLKRFTLRPEIFGRFFRFRDVDLGFKASSVKVPPEQSGNAKSQNL